MRSRLKFIATLYLVAILSFCTGIIIMIVETWPYNHIIALKKYLDGGSEEDKTLLEKIENDVNLKPSRLISTYIIPKDQQHKFKTVSLNNIRARRALPEVYLTERMGQGFYLIYGTFDFENTLHGAILLNNKGKVVHTWEISEDHVKRKHEAESNKYPHGMEILADGSLVFSFDGGSGLHKIDVCGNVMWTTLGNFHHSVTHDGNGHVWAWRNDDMVKLELQGGKVIQTVTIGDIGKSNRDLDIFWIRQKDFLSHSKWTHDPHHQNDVDPLPEDLARYFPQYNTGDLLLSFRSLDLVTVIDPDTAKVKWWRMGQWRRQHDPDWHQDGKLYVFDNNMHRKYSRIIRIDPDTMVSEVVVDGKDIGFYSAHKGKLNVTKNDHVLISSTMQGRVIEVNAQGTPVFEFINRYNTQKNEVLLISEARFLDKNYFDPGIFGKCH